MSIRVKLIRHGESELNLRPDILSGRSNHVPLTARGEEEARALGVRFRELGFSPSQVFSSPAVRARQTAGRVLAAMGIEDHPLMLADELQELYQGEWEGWSRANTYDDPTVATEIERMGLDFKAPGGESMRGVGVRMLGWLNQLAADSDESAIAETILGFTHVQSIRSLAADLNGWTRQQAYAVHVPNASVSMFVLQGRVWRVEYIGREAADLGVINK